MSAQPSRRHAAGFTLTEILVVILVGALIAGLTVPSMSNVLRRSRLEEAAGRLESALRLARQKALARRTHYQVAILPSLGEYRVAFEDTSGAWAPDRDSLYTMPPGIGMQGDAGGTPFTASTSRVDVLFEPRGTLAERDAPLEVVMYNDKGDTVQIEMVRTGRVRLWRR
jgi:prepilin-type N-terminal cleavage/methylation domain-containing protein